MTEVLSSIVTDAAPAVRSRTPRRSVDADVVLSARALRVGHARALLDDFAAEALELGLKRLQVLARRDLEHPEAGESELHAHRVAALWAQAGLDVTLRSAATGVDSVTELSGYHLVRTSRRDTVFPRSAVRGFLGRRGRPDGLVEIWDGMPFLSPLWAHCPRVVVVHHPHAELWQTSRSRRMARLGQAVERHLAPSLYRRTRIVTGSPSCRDELVSVLGFDPDRIDVVPYGVDPMFCAEGERSAAPLVVAEGRLVRAERFDTLIETLLDARRFIPGLEAEIIGEGHEQPRLEAQIENAGARDWITLRGRLTDDERRDTFRRGWVVASTSARAGWDMTIDDAGACGTPAVCTAVAGHRDCVRHEVSGLLAEPGRDFTAALVRVLKDEVLRERLSRGAVQRAAELTWEESAAGLLASLVGEATAGR